MKSINLNVRKYRNFSHVKTGNEEVQRKKFSCFFPLSNSLSTSGWIQVVLLVFYNIFRCGHFLRNAKNSLFEVNKVKFQKRENKMNLTGNVIL